MTRVQAEPVIGCALVGEMTFHIPEPQLSNKKQTNGSSLQCDKSHNGDQIAGEVRHEQGNRGDRGQRSRSGDWQKYPRIETQQPWIIAPKECDNEQLGRRSRERSTREIDRLVNELHSLRKKLKNDGDLIERAIAQHSQFSQGAMQLTTMIADNVKRLPTS